MREKIENMIALAAALRSSAREATDWRDGLRLVAEALEGKHDGLAPTVHWIGPFTHHGKKCPVPPQTVVRVTTRDGVSTEHGLEVRAWDWAWDNGGEENDSDITSFSYAADNPEGWIERPEGWSPPPPEKEDFTDWTAAHIRLLPRKRGPMSDAKRQAQRLADLWEGHTFTVPTPIPADTRAVVREALEEIDAGYAKSFPQGPECEAMGLLPEWRCQWRRVRAALAALDALPAESETLGYGVLTEGLGLSFRTTRAEAETTATIMCGAGRGKFRIVRLVAEPGQ